MKSHFFICCCFCLLALCAKATECVNRLDCMSDEQKAAQMLLVYYADVEFTLKNEFGGVLLSGNAFNKPRQLKKDLEELQQDSNIPVLIALDHEGGKVNRLQKLEGWSQTLSAEDLGKLSAIEVQKHAEKAAEFLSDIGVNMNLAPVLDPLENKEGKDTWVSANKRSFGSNDQILSAASAYAHGFKKYGIVSISKHFPGYLSSINSDVQSATVDIASDFLNSVSRPFVSLADVTAGTMMANHSYKLGSEPAVLSAGLVASARKIYPEGLILTDDLWVDGIRLWGASTDDKDEQLLHVTRKAIKSGCDILLITYPEKAIMMKKEIVKWMRADKLIRKKVDEAVHRIINFKEKEIH